MTVVNYFAPILARIAVAFKNIRIRLADRRANAIASRSLEALTDRELDDIGLHRSMIRSYVNGDKNV